MEGGFDDDAKALAEPIDRHVQARLDAEVQSHVSEAEDAGVLWRVFLDLPGVVPSAERAARFPSTRDPEQRDQLFEEQLADSRFGKHFGVVTHALFPEAIWGFDAHSEEPIARMRIR